MLLIIARFVGFEVRHSSSHLITRHSSTLSQLQVCLLVLSTTNIPLILAIGILAALLSSLRRKLTSRDAMSYQGDVEESGSSERTPMLGGSSQSESSSANGDKKWSLIHVLRFFGGGIYAPDPSTYDPIKILLNTDDERERDELTVRWRDNKLSELNFVGIVVRT